MADDTTEQNTVYELRIYTTHGGRLADLHSRFRDHTMKLFEKHGIKNIAYWVPLEKPESENTLVYVIAHKSREAAAESWEKFRSDPIWQQVARESEKNGPILSKRPESIFLADTDFSPKMSAEATDRDSSRVFELRRYTTAKGRLPNLLQRFRDGELDLFEKHGMTNFVYWTPLDQDDTLIYVVAHRDREAAKKSWEDFGTDPDWKSLRAASLESGPIVTKVDSQFLVPTDYSSVK